MKENGVIDVYPKPPFYFTTANFGTVDVLVEKHQDVYDAVKAPVERFTL